jgi:fucose 4-O-acetylase-like acetyltransferase
MKKTIFQALILFALIEIMYYSLFSFYALSIKPNEWTADSRLGFTFLTFFAFIMCIAIYAIITIKNKLN